MKSITIKFGWLVALILPMLVACDPNNEDELELGPAPTEEDAMIQMAVSSENENIIVFSNDSEGFLKVWDFGNGASGEGNEVEAYYPFKGEYTATLTVYTKGGSVKSTKQVTINATDPEICNVETLKLLTGGCGVPEGKTWVIDSAQSAHFGVGPEASTYPDWYQAGANEKAGSGLYNDRYTFELINYVFKMDPNGDVFINDDQMGNFPGSYENAGDATAPYDMPENATWIVDDGDDGYDGYEYLNTTNGSLIGFYTGVTQYRIDSIGENILSLSYKDINDAALRWYIRLVPADFVAPPPPPVETSTLPITFEAAEPPFNGFGGSVYTVVDNPNTNGINNSAKVGEYVKGLEGSWAGLETILDGAIDFTGQPFIQYKVYSPVTGRALFKLETTDGSAEPVEVYADVTKTNEWEVLSFDFSAAASGTYNKIALFLDFDNNAGGTFYIDDIRQSVIPGMMPLTFEVEEPAVSTFGGSSAEYIDNPDPTGVNNSSRVLQTTHGGETWAGLFIDLYEPLDFSTNTSLKLKVWAPSTGTFRLKLENVIDSGDFVEVDVTVNNANQWEELTFDLTGVPPRYSRVVMFPGWDVANAGTFYLDDITQ